VASLRLQIKIKIPDDLHRGLKSTIEESGFPLDDFVAHAIEEKLRQHPSRKGKPWMKSFGGLKPVHGGERENSADHRRRVRADRLTASVCVHSTKVLLRKSG